MRFWKVGELSKRTGISVRMLRHYDEMGLCSPANRSEAGYRLYTEGDISRLQRVVSLRQLGFSLEEIRDCLEQPAFSAARVVDLHLSRLDSLIESQQRLRGRLERVAQHLRSADGVSAEEFIQLIEAITMFEKYYTPEQLEELKQRADALGESGMRQAETDWAELGAAVRAEMDKGTDPADERVQALARRWTALISAFTGGNPAIEKSLSNLWQNERPALAERYGTGNFDTGMSEYIGRAMAAAKKEE